jgi:hypothetical protein
MPKKVWLYIPDDLGVKVTAWSNRLGVTQNQLLLMCVHAGIGNVIRAVAPEEGVSSAVLADVLQILKERGVLDAESLESLTKA